MKKSESTAELTKALVKAQTSYNALIKDSSNPFFKSKYADLAACIECTREPLANNGLAVIQSTDMDGSITVVETTLLHVSGEWISGKYPLTPTKPDCQGLGAALTYARRYALTAMLGIAAEDDDGNTASSLTPKPQSTKPAATPPNQAYSNTVYTEETIKKIGKLEKDGLKGKDCLKAFLPEYVTATKTAYKNISEMDDKILNELIKFIENRPPKGM